MIAPKFLPLVLRQVYRAPLRSFLTISGVAVSMFLFAAVQAMQAGVERATTQQAGDTTLIVYRKDRYCPFSSQMPQSYEQQIRRIPGVASVAPMKIVVSNCRTSLDVVTFRGVPPEQFVETFGEQMRSSPARSKIGNTAGMPPSSEKPSPGGAAFGSAITSRRPG